jgi:membrane protein DedA with SNARE-associated domain
LLGEMIWTGTLLFIGFYTTEAIKVVAQGVTYLILVISVLFLGVIFWQGRRMLMQTKEFTDAISKDENGDRK